MTSPIAPNDDEKSHLFAGRRLSRRSFLAATVAIPAAVALTDAAATAAAKANFVQHGRRDIKQFALTFHGGGDPALAERVRVITKRLHAPITVFAIGSWVDANPATVKAFVADGHELANHTATHPSLRRLDRAGVASEIAGAAASLERVTGHIGFWFRPSGTPTPTTLMLEESLRAGYPTVVGYEVDPLDYQDPGASKVASRTLAAIQAGSIVSLHLGHSGTADALEQIIAGARTHGLRPVTVHTLLAS